MFPIELDERLSSIGSLVREGAFLIDVGTDHAYLPIALLKSGKIAGAIASDINEGPCKRADMNARLAGLSSKIKIMKADGVPNIPLDGKTDIVIAGMGGTLIEEIVERADLKKISDTRLILQPMRNTAELRKYLCENGFSIEDEMLSREKDRIYEVICASYDGEKHNYSDLDLVLGKKNIDKKREYPGLFAYLCEKKISSLTKKAEGKESSGKDASFERGLIEEIKKERNGTEN